MLGSQVGRWAVGHLEDSKSSVSPPLLSTRHMAMNVDLLAPGSSVFYLRGTTRERVPAIVVGLSSFPEGSVVKMSKKNFFFKKKFLLSFKTE